MQIKDPDLQAKGELLGGFRDLERDPASIGYAGPLVHLAVQLNPAPSVRYSPSICQPGIAFAASPHPLAGSLLQAIIISSTLTGSPLQAVIGTLKHSLTHSATPIAYSPHPLIFPYSSLSAVRPSSAHCLTPPGLHSSPADFAGHTS
ncbi:hypothetical protein L1049_021685 [Liquidambar formosana]|uniref:Uncharacterized protein n=1 Tax=Liquidambar formosana TaxID=63359 RepID=A0AAP0RD88_LIQFO